jgi:hypothetical protein
MKKTFPLHVTGKADARVRDAIKHEVRKYVKRERSKPLPEGFERWTFACRVGGEPATAKPFLLKDVSAAIDEVAKAGSDHIHIEVVGVPVERSPNHSRSLSR